ncbi:MAG: AbrB/MazE/SpoVT family DNA-binding domain-containing protein [Candidatus Methanospirareceae archaeon]
MKMNTAAQTQTQTRTQISKGRITIPEPLREEYELQEGAYILLIPLEEGIMVKRGGSGGREMKSLRGSVKEVEVEKASKFIRELRSKWRIK